jgi:hypothetical protein
MYIQNMNIHRRLLFLFTDFLYFFTPRIDWAKIFHYKTVTEGVKSIVQINMFKERQCYCFQRYFFSKASPADALPKIVHKNPYKFKIISIPFLYKLKLKSVKKSTNLRLVFH